MQIVEILALSVSCARALLELPERSVSTLPSIETAPLAERDAAVFIQMDARLERGALTESTVEIHVPSASATSRPGGGQASGRVANATSLAARHCDDAHCGATRNKSAGKNIPFGNAAASRNNTAREAPPHSVAKAANNTRSNVSQKAQKAKAAAAKVHHGTGNGAGMPQLSLVASTVDSKQLPDIRQGTPHDVVVVGLLISGIDFNTLMAADGMREVITRELKEMISRKALHHGVTTAHIDVELSPGSVVVRAYIHPPEGVTAQEIQATLETVDDNMRADIANRAQAIHGLDILKSDGPISISQVSVTVVPWVPKELADDTWVNGVFPQHEPGDSFADFVVFVIFLILVCLACEICGRCIAGKKRNQGSR